MTAVKALARCAGGARREGKERERERARGRDGDGEMMDWEGEGVEGEGVEKEGERARREREEIAMAARRDGMGVVGQRREQVALGEAYARAFAWWPHAGASRRQCESFLRKYAG